MGKASSQVGEAVGSSLDAVTLGVCQYRRPLHQGPLSNTSKCFYNVPGIAPSPSQAVHNNPLGRPA